jgi:hypothetical protein
MPHMPEETRTLLREWERRCRRNLDTHAWAERSLDRWNAVTSVLSIGSLVALGVVAAGFDLTKGKARYWIVALTVMGALASVILTVRDFGSKAVAHRSACRQYGVLCREMEKLAAEDLEPKTFLDRMGEIQRRWDWIADVAPNASTRIRRRADAKPYPARYI